MEEIKTKKMVKKKSGNGFLVLLNGLILLFVVGLFFKTPVSKAAVTTDKIDHQEFKSAAIRLKSKGFTLESADLFHRYYQTLFNPSEKIKILSQLVDLYAFEHPKETLKVLSLLESLDPEEKSSQYKKMTYDILKLMAKDKDAELYLKSATSMSKNIGTKGSKNLVVASIKGEEVYYSELENFAKDFPQKVENKDLISQLLVKKLLQKESEPLLQDPDFKSFASKSLSDLRVSFFMNKEMSKFEVSEFDLKNYYQANLFKYVYPKSYKLSHLLIKEETSVSQFLSSPPKSLQEFESAVEQFSIDLNKNTQGKIEAWIQKDFIPLTGKVTGLMEFLENQKLSSLSSPLKSSKGTHFFWIHNKREAQDLKYESAKEMVKRAYKQEHQQNFQQEYFTKLFKKYEVVLHEDRL
ncbi:MAG: hypothetical protein KC646_14665 [Candidatus Cloacimonetes bacterium]|nr:hypothetical protein [Candidatus Cloacimonadota bacterium]